MSSRVTPALSFGTALLSVLTALAPMPAIAQEADSSERIDILIPPPVNQQRVEQCEEDEEAATISGEIVVCRQIRDQSEYRYSSDYEDKRAARQEQIDKFGLPSGLPADFAGPGIFRGPATVGGMCLPGSCPPPAALIIDIEALPEAPPGSDADRIARGLPPIGNDKGTSGKPDGVASQDTVLALPPAPDFTERELSRAGSEEPEG